MPAVSLLAPELVSIAPVLARADDGERLAAASDLVRHPRQMLRLGRTLRDLPVVEVTLTDSVSGREIEAAVMHRRFRVPTGRVARATLEIPTDASAYTRGRHRQAMRTNLARARSSGITTSVVTPDELGALPEAATRPAWRAHLMWVQRTFQPYDASEAVILVAWDAECRPLAVIGAILDVDVALLKAHVSDGDGTGRSEARYLLMGALVTALAERGCRLLLSDSALTLPRGVAYFQHLAGFAPRNLRLTRNG